MAGGQSLDLLNHFLAAEVVVLILQCPERNLVIDGIFRAAEGSINWQMRQATISALNRIKTAVIVVLDTSRYYWKKGIPSPEEWAAYVSRLKLAEMRGFPVVDDGSFDEKYPFEKVVNHKGR